MFNVKVALKPAFHILKTDAVRYDDEKQQVDRMSCTFSPSLAPVHWNVEGRTACVWIVVFVVVIHGQRIVLLPVRAVIAWCIVFYSARQSCRLFIPSCIVFDRCSRISFYTLLFQAISSHCHYHYEVLRPFEGFLRSCCAQLCERL